MENRERILVAAEQAFGAQGAAASTEQIARQAQVGIGTVFRHFPTKQDLIEATAVRHLKNLEDEVRQLTDGVAPGEAFASMMRVLVSTGAAKVTLLDLLPTGDVSEVVATGVESFRDAIRRVLQRAQDAGSVRPDATGDDVSTLVLALSHVAEPGESEAVDRAVQIVLDGFSVHP